MIFTSSWCFADSRKIPIKIINNSNDSISQELIKVLKDQIAKSSFARLVVTEPSKIEIIVTTKNKVATKLPPSLTVKQAKRYEGLTLSANNPFIDLDDFFQTEQELARLREKAAIWEAEHSNQEEKSISYSIIWVKKEHGQSIYLDTMLGFCESNTMKLITKDIITKTSILIDKSL